MNYNDRGGVLGEGLAVWRKKPVSRYAEEKWRYAIQYYMMKNLTKLNVSVSVFICNVKKDNMACCPISKYI